MDQLQHTHVKLLAADLQTLAARGAARAEAVGVVVSRDRANKFLKFLVDDGSGCVPCILWLNHHLLRGGGGGGSIAFDLAAEAAEEQAEAVRLGEVVRVRGRVGVYRGSVQITVGDLVVERDPNAEVLHWLECLKLARVCYDLKRIGS